MTADERLALIRAKAGKREGHQARPLGLFLAANPGVPSAVKPNARLAPSGGHWRGKGFGRMKGRTVAGHVTKLETPAKQAEWRPEFRKGAHWLTRVAEGWRRG